jgi:uncharacterized protein involved in exopolysaccharide biosynthesis
VTTTPPSQELTLRELTHRIVERRWLLLGTFVVVFGLIVAYTFAVTPRYKSWARLRIESKTQSGGGLASAMSDQMSGAAGGAGSLLGLGRDELETEVGVLRSDRVRDAVIDSLGLSIQVRKPSGSRARVFSSIHVVDPNDDVEGKLTFTQQSPGRYTIEKSKLEEVRNLPASVSAGDSIRVGGTVLTLSRDLARGGPDEIVVRVLPRYKVHDLMDRRLSIERQEGGSRLVEVTYEDPDRQLAADVVRRVIDEYVTYSTALEKLQDTTAVGRIRVQVDSTARVLAAAETTLRAFEERSLLIDPQEQSAAQVKRISTISAKVDAITVERNALAKMLEVIDQRSKGQSGASAYRQLATFPSLITNRAIQDLLQSLVELENKRAQLGATRTENNPDYRVLTDRIREIESQLYSLGPQYLESLDQELATTAQTVAALTDTMKALPAAATRYLQLVRERTLREATYLALQKQLKQAELTDVLRPERVHVVDAPRIANPDDPAFPKKPVMVVLGLVLAAAVSIMLGLAIELWRGPDRIPLTQTEVALS